MTDGGSTYLQLETAAVRLRLQKEAYSKRHISKRLKNKLINLVSALLYAKRGKLDWATLYSK